MCLSGLSFGVVFIFSASFGPTETKCLFELCQQVLFPRIPANPRGIVQLIKSINFCAPFVAIAYADDTQLYLGFNPASAKERIQAVKDIENCISDIRAWMLTRRLKINDDKTELLVIDTNQELPKVPNLSIKVGSADIKTSDTARNLGVIFDDIMTMEKHVNDISKKAFSQLRRLRQIRQYL